MKNVMDWQRRFNAGPSIWTVVSEGGLDGNLYESKEAAEVEAAWRRALGHKGYTVLERKVHTLALAQERWEISNRPGPPVGAEEGARV